MAILKRKEENAYEKRQVKKIVVAASMGVLLLSAVPVSAASKTAYNHTMTYSSGKVSDTSAYASTTCSGAKVKYVKARLTYVYRLEGYNYTGTESASQTYATTASYTVNNPDAYIYQTSGYHEAAVTYQGYNKTIVATS